MNYILFDDSNRNNLLPFTFTRPVADIRVGIMTLRQKWEFFLKQKTYSITEKYLSKKFPLNIEDDNTLINGSVFPSLQLVNEIKALGKDETLYYDGKIIAFRTGREMSEKFQIPRGKSTNSKQNVKFLSALWQIFTLNPWAVNEDFILITGGRKSQPLSDTNFVTGNKNLIFLEEGAKAEYTFLNTTGGPIYIGKNAEIMEGSKIRGPFALCEHSIIKMDAKIYSGTTIGPWSKAGGEINNSVIFGFSNKAHDGFLGNSVLGEWCNIGADTNVSNLKNTYDHVKLWSYSQQRFVDTGEQFCGLMLADHSKTGINTMFNTGTVVGVNANIFGDGYQRNYIPSFSWGGPQGYKKFNLQKAFQVAEAVFKRRNRIFDDTEKEILTHLYNDIRYVKK
jgi:UDP-N-acetylglucosamine diphosphorylase/glucosamine-1-phosphate N-acetyltransferase